MREPLSSLDQSFLSLEAANTPMHAGAVLVLGPGGAFGADARALAEIGRERTGTVPRLHLRLEPAGFPLRSATWVEDPVFDAALHVRHEQLASPGDRAVLADRVAELMAVPLARDRPLWDLHVLGGLDQDRTSVLVRIHPALAWGLDAVDLVLGLFDGLHGSAQDQSVVSIMPRLESADRATAGGLMAGASAGLNRGARLVDPRRVPAELAGRVERAVETARITAAVARGLAGPAPRSALNGALGPPRRVEMRCLDLDDIHGVRKVHAGTVNDVVLAAIAGGLRSWMAAQGNLCEQPLRVWIPVSRRNGPDRGAGGLHSGYLVDLPIDEPDPIARLHAVRTAMSVNKLAGSNRGPGAFPVLAERIPAGLSRLAGPVAGRLTAFLGTRLFNLVVTTVPLPDLPLRMAGRPLEEVYPVVPLGSGQALSLAVATHREQLHIGLHADPDLVVHLDRLGDAIVAALTDLVGTAGIVTDRAGMDETPE